MGLSGILLALGLLIWLAYRGWSVLLVAPAAAALAAALSGEPPLASWTQPFMAGAARFIAQFFPLFLLGAVFGKLMEASGSALAIARGLTARLGRERAVLSVVLACAVLTYGGVSLFVVAFAVAPVAAALFREADIPRRLIPAAIALGAFTFTMTALPGTPAIQNAIPMPYFGTTPWAAPGVGVLAAAVMLGFGLWWLRRAEAAARRAGEGFGGEGRTGAKADEEELREHATTVDSFDPAELAHGGRAREGDLPPTWLAALPILVVVGVNLAVTALVLPRLDAGWLAEERWGGTTLQAVGGVWAVLIGLIAAILVIALANLRRLPGLRGCLDAGANAAVLPALNTASQVGFGAVVAGLPAFAAVRDGLLELGGGPLVSLAVATNVLAGITGSASGGLTIALEALGGNYAALAAERGIDPALMHRIAAIATGGLDALPHNGAVITLLAITGVTHREGYRHIAMVAIAGPLLSLVVAILAGALLGGF
ncbi:citrate transporter [Caldovatus sediminis]|uniref:Citrate transporter n=1 Tax=Caldovatus sediminis TaxID=2041189 RepID=A0A8J2ZCP5_9PROT|nr:GntP family permease [Caldovatus sediminis]GGG40365.1 citrate transporter [Caldovatus sediminis]